MNASHRMQFLSVRSHSVLWSMDREKQLKDLEIRKLTMYPEKNGSLQAEPLVQILHCEHMCINQH